MAQPIGVRTDDSQGESFLLVPADHALVVGLPMLPWAQHGDVNGVAFASLHHFQAARIFGPYLRLAKGQQDQAFARQISVFSFKLDTAAWERVLSAYVKAGLVEAVAEIGATTIIEFVNALDSLSFDDVSDLELHVADFAPCEPFDQPAVPGVPAQPAVYQGRGARRRCISAAVPAQPGVAAQPGPASLRFLDLARITSMESSGEAQPMWELSYLAGMLGPCFTRRSREDEQSSVRLIAPALHAALRSRFQVDTDAGAAAHLKDLLASSMLSQYFMAHTWSEEELRKEGRDALLWGGAPADQTRVEISRLSYIGIWYVPAPLQLVPKPTLGHVAC